MMLDDMVPQYIDYASDLRYYNVQKFIYYNLDIERFLGPQWGQLITLTDVKSGSACDYIVCGFLDYAKYSGIIIKAVNHDNFFTKSTEVAPLKFKEEPEVNHLDYKEFAKHETANFVIVPKLDKLPFGSAYCTLL